MVSPAATDSAGGYAGRVVWITGASAGIGEALARAFAREGARLVLTARREQELQRVAASLAATEPPLVLASDVTAYADIPRQLALIAERFGAIDVLALNAGVSQRSLVADTSLETYRHLMELDFFAPVVLSKAVLPQMIARRSGTIVVTSSVAGKFGTPLRSGYCAAKHAVQGFFDSLRAEVAKDGVRVSTIVAGAIRTDVSINAVLGDGSPNGIMEELQAQGIDPAVAADQILSALRRGEPEIEIAEGPSLMALQMSQTDKRKLFAMFETPA